eukprot:scaffold28524_cov36-Cyclotella_meneghiniana.AAC.1
MKSFNTRRSNSNSDQFLATSPAMSGKSEARIIGSAVAGVSELALFHPVDTVYLQFSLQQCIAFLSSSPVLTKTNDTQLPNA